MMSDKEFDDRMTEIVSNYAVRITTHSKLIAVDFDGTICEDNHDIMNPGKILEGCREVLKDLYSDKRNVLILNTLRDHDLKHPHGISVALRVALEFLFENDLGIFLLPRFFSFWGRKLDVCVFIDDRNAGCEMDWKVIRKDLVRRGLLNY